MNQTQKTQTKNWKEVYTEIGYENLLYNREIFTIERTKTMVSKTRPLDWQLEAGNSDILSQQEKSCSAERRTAMLI